MSPSYKQSWSSTFPAHHWTTSCKNNGVRLSPAICPLWCVTPLPPTKDTRGVTEKEAAWKSGRKMEGDTEGGVNKARLLYNHIWEAVITAWALRQLSSSTTDPAALWDLTVLYGSDCCLHQLSGQRAYGSSLVCCRKTLLRCCDFVRMQRYWLLLRTSSHHATNFDDQ